MYFTLKQMLTPCLETVASGQWRTKRGRWNEDREGGKGV